MNSKIAHWLELHVQNGTLRQCLFFLLIPAMVIEYAIKDRGDFKQPPPADESEK